MHQKKRAGKGRGAGGGQRGRGLKNKRRLCAYLPREGTGGREEKKGATLEKPREGGKPASKGIISQVRTANSPSQLGAWTEK